MVQPRDCNHTYGARMVSRRAPGLFERMGVLDCPLVRVRYSALQTPLGRVELMLVCISTNNIEDMEVEL